MCGVTLPMNDSSENALALRCSVLSGQLVGEDVGGAFVIDEIDPERILPAGRAATELPATVPRDPGGDLGA